MEWINLPLHCEIWFPMLFIRLFLLFHLRSILAAVLFHVKNLPQMEAERSEYSRQLVRIKGTRKPVPRQWGGVRGNTKVQLDKAGIFHVEKLLIFLLFFSFMKRVVLRPASSSLLQSVCREPLIGISDGKSGKCYLCYIIKSYYFLCKFRTRSGDRSSKGNWIFPTCAPFNGKMMLRVRAMNCMPSELTPKKYTYPILYIVVWSLSWMKVESP